MSTGASGGTSESPWITIGLQNLLNNSLFKRGDRSNDTTTGTWTSVDPITKLNDPGNADPYAYAGDDPINNIDPSGRNWLSGLGELVCAVAGFEVASQLTEAGIEINLGFPVCGAAVLSVDAAAITGSTHSAVD